MAGISTSFILSTPSLGITYASEGRFRTAAEYDLSTPSLGITRGPYLTISHLFVHTFNSLSRDHDAIFDELEAEGYAFNSLSRDHLIESRDSS